MIIKLLSESTINKIAAGEVIERPSSVVKELVENAIDAGAKNIDISLEKSGKNLIMVSDDGCGMSCDDLELAILRHTTSKLNEDDLLDINSFGFRGEALPSIAAISRLSITSKNIKDDKAYRLSISGGMDKKIEQVSHKVGTKIEVRDLFFATPARLKFLRTDKTELAACLDVVKKIAMSHHDVSFSLWHDGKSLLKVKAVIDNPQQRITDILTQAFLENAAKIHFEQSELSITGYTSIPTFNRSSAEDQFLFVNNRPVKDKVLSSALRIAYKDYLAIHAHPVSVIFLNINSKNVDVNVHPAKSEVRFHDANLVRTTMIMAIQDALIQNSGRVVSDPVKTMNYFNFPTRNFAAESQTSSKYQHHKTINPIRTQTQYHQTELFVHNPNAKVVDEEIAHINIEQKQGYLGAAKAQVHKNYIISQTEDSLIIVDQHAAHERLGYEKIKHYIKNNGLIKQRLLSPEVVELPDTKRADIVLEYKENLLNLGLSFDNFGERSIIVYEVPSILGSIDVTRLINDIADYLLSIGHEVAITEMIEHITETYACHYAIRSGRILSIHEMNELLRQMEQTPFSGQCNHGRPTYVELKLSDIEKLFGRR